MQLNLLHRLRLDSLRSRLLLLVTLSLVPPLALNLYGAMRERRHAISVAEKDIQRLTTLAASSEAKYIEGARQFLIALSDVPDLVGDPALCSATLQTMLKKNIGYVNLGLLDLQGNVRCSAVKPADVVNVGDRGHFKKTVASGKFAVGDYVFGRIIRKPAVVATYPVTDQNDKIIAVVFASLNLNTLDQFANDIDLPRNAVMITTDSTGTIIGRRPNPEQWVGTRALQQLFDGMVKVGFGTAEITGSDNIKRLHAFAPVGGSDTSDFTVSIGLPTADIVESANRDQVAELLTLAVTAALALLTAWFVANVTIIDRIQALVSAARRIAAGQLSTRSGIDYGREEISELARAFDRMAYSLQHSAAERDDAQARLFAEKERAQVTLQSIGDAVITTDQDGCVEYMNPVAESLTGWSTDEAFGKPLATVFNVINGTTRETLPSVAIKALEHGRTEAIGRDSVLIGRDGSEHAVEDSAAPIRNRDQDIVGTVVVFHDVSQSRNLSRQLSHQASHDPLTGLVNRREFEKRLQLLIDHSSQQSRQHALLFMDLDRFKIVNDTCGHNAGDELLRQITALLQPLQRDSDTLARVGGDEFAALLENCSPASAARIAEKLCKTICEFRFTWQNQIFPIGVSIGLVNFGSDVLNMVDLMKAADGACYQAKDEGRNRVHQYKRDESGDAMKGENAWRANIQRALDTDRFVLLSQEVQPLKSSQLHLPPSVSRLDRSEPLIHHYEIQVRMLGEHGVHILPAAFMPAAERHGLMPAIDRWTMRHAFAHHANQIRRNTAHANAICAISVSANALNDSTFISFVRDLFDEFSIPGQSICFEIAETTAITYLSQGMQFIDTMKSMGCFIALDDFGSGMSSFSYLSHLGVDFVKIDGAFIDNLPNDIIDRAKIEAINNVSHAMNILTIAKQVQSQQALEILREIGVDHVQGNAVEALETLPENNGMPV